ncbi:MAG: cytochrome c family protein [Planctomycetales bacterium]|nr:cytochrome c family protein [Planctomycetales bacterium]
MTGSGVFRLASGAAIVGLLGWLLLSSPVPTPTGATPWAGPASCEGCHADVAAEWRQSGHAIAWTSPALRAESLRFGGLADCVACHAPDLVLASESGKPPAARSSGREHGVDCLSCHGRPGGEAGVAAARDLAASPCGAASEPRLSAPSTCGSCHRATHEDWRAAPADRRGEGCVSCHMPEVARAGGRKGRHHGRRPSREIETLRGAVRLAAVVRGGTFEVAIENLTAHNVPGERHFRLLYVECEVRDATGAVTYRDRRSVKGVTPFRGERREDPIAAGETVRYAWRLEEKSGVAEARLLYKLFPHHLDADAVLIAEGRAGF